MTQSFSPVVVVQAVVQEEEIHGTESYVKVKFIPVTQNNNFPVWLITSTTSSMVPFQMPTNGCGTRECLSKPGVDSGVDLFSSFLFWTE